MILLASDTETKPSEGMRKAIYKAEVGDEQKGTDPSVNKLLKRTASILGKEAALFLPSGTMCNLVAIKEHTNPAEVIIADSMSHIIRAESAGLSLCSGLMVEPIDTADGTFSKDELVNSLKKIRTAAVPYSPKPSLISVEQTHNFKGGTTWSVEQLKEIKEIASQEKLKIHMDGARLFNAVISEKTDADEFGKIVDSVWIDFTKGLGAPMGAVLAGDADFIERCRHTKHIFGGALRQAGIAAAGCLHALENNIERIIDDHENAKYLANELSKISEIEVRDNNPATNMVFFRPILENLAVNELMAEMEKENVSISILGNYLRAVTHLNTDRSDIKKAVDVIKKIVMKNK